jgi:hypothetical protein
MAGALLTLASVSAQAATIQGSLSLSGFQVTQNGADLSTSTLVFATATKYAGTATGDFSPINASATPDFSGNTIILANLNSFSFASALFGSFNVVGAGSGATILAHTSTLLDIFFVGTYTPGTGLSPATAGLASARVTINMNGGALSEAITLQAPPATVPEPASIAMAGLGLAAAGLVSGLRKRSV